MSAPESTRFSDYADRLINHASETFSREARLILAHAFGVSQSRLSVMREEQIPWEKIQLAERMLAERSANAPMSHVLGYRDFYKHRLIVTPDVLDPRPDTETLVELALSEPFSELLDLGTGSGCIPISLLAERHEATGIATDISAAALAVAVRNAEKVGVADRLHFEQSDWLEAVGGTYDLIVSNPPYISEDVYETLSPEVHHEPKVALTPGGDGLEAYRVIARDAPGHLKPGGRLLVEIGFDQGAAVSDLFAQVGLEDVTVHPDLNGKDRVISARARAK